MSMFGTFVEKIQQLGLEYFSLYYGKYRGIVTRNDDPQQRGRIQARVPTVGHDKAPDRWIDPSLGMAGPSRGTFWPPEVGDSVWVWFENGDAGAPNAYLGGWYGKGEVPNEFAYSDGKPQRRGWITKSGHQIVFDDTPGEEQIRIVWHKPEENDESLEEDEPSADRTEGDFSYLSFEDDGSIKLANKNGSFVELNATEGHILAMDENGSALVMDSDGIKAADSSGNAIQLANGEATILAQSTAHVVGKTVNLKGGSVFVGDGATQSVVLGERLLTYLNTHTHPSSSGPTGTPTVPATNALLSSSVKTKS